MPFEHTYELFFLFFLGFQSFTKIKEKKNSKDLTKLSITLSITKIYKPYIMVELNLYKNKHGEP